VDGRELNMCETFGVHSSLLSRGNWFSRNVRRAPLKLLFANRQQLLTHGAVLETRSSFCISAYYCLTFRAGCRSIRAERSTQRGLRVGVPSALRSSREQQELLYEPRYRAAETVLPANQVR
jgi:hypothetical protein